MNDTVTILTSTTGKQIAKAFRGADYQPVQFNPGSGFLVTQTPVHNLESLAAVISELETEPTKAIIRGSLFEDPSGTVPRNKGTFTSPPRQWCMIDIDSLAWDGAFDDQQAMLCYAMLCYAMLCYAMLSFAIRYMWRCSQTNKLRYQVTFTTAVNICF